MKPRQYLILFLIFFGELLIVLSFLHFSLFTPGRIVTLNIVVTSIIFLAYMLNLLQPRYLFSDRSQKTFAGMGIRGYALLAYTIAAIGLMVNMNGFPAASFTTQLLVHAVLLFLLGLGLFFSATATDKAGEIYLEQTAQRAALDSARRVAAGIAEKTRRTALAQADKDRIGQIVAELRYISPANSAEAAHLEQLLLTSLQNLDAVLSLPAPDSEKVNEIVLDFESLCQQRKQVYSY